MSQTNSRIAKLISSLSSEELGRFKLWLVAEIGGNQGHLPAWLEALEEEEDIETIWSVAIPDKPFKAATAARYNFELTEWIEEFMAIEAFRKDTFAKTLYLNRFIIRRAPSELYPGTIKKSRKRLEAKDQTIRDYTYYRLQFELDRLDTEYRNLFPGNKIRRYTFDPEKVKKHEELSLLLSQIELATNRMSKRQPLTDFDQLIFEKLKAYVRNSSAPENSLAQLYLSVFRYLQEKTVLTVPEAQQLIAQYHDQYFNLRPDARFNTSIHIQNILVLSAYQQDPKLIAPEIFNFYVQLLDRGETNINRYFYHNLIQICCIMANKYDKREREHANYLKQAHEFLESQKEKLAESERNEVYQYNLANILFREGAYQQLSRQIPTTEFRDFAYEINYLMLRLKARYELGDLWYLPEHLKNLYERVKNSHKLTPAIKRRLQNEISMFRKVLLASRKSTAQRLEKEVIANSNISGKKWLLEKIREKMKA